MQARLDEPEQEARRWVPVEAPVHVLETDLDGDGQPDFVISSIGQLAPGDIDDGRVLWACPRKDGSPELVTLAAGLGRVARTAAADLDLDCDLDIVVAVFGYRKTGGLLLLEQVDADGGPPVFRRSLLDPRAGQVDLALRDLDDDGRVDIVSAVAQEHEEVVAWMNQGGLGFSPRVIFAAPHPAWGLTGIEVDDLDGDGDLDVLSVSGDHLDGLELKPYHGIYLSRNQGNLEFKTDQLLHLPAAIRVRSGDLDADGDLDIVACALPSPAALPSDEVGEFRLATLVWLEQDEPGIFTRHVVDAGASGYADVALADFDGDGDLDLIGGRMRLVEFSGVASTPALGVKLFCNTSDSKPTSRARTSGR